jgi:hypothetical protein
VTESQAAGAATANGVAVTTLADEELTVMISADEIAPEAVALEPVRDIEPYLRGADYLSRVRPAHAQDLRHHLRA